jgi:BNR repeat-like domain
MRALILTFAVAALVAGEAEHNHHPVGVTDGVASLDVYVDGVTTHLLLAIATPEKTSRVEHRSSQDGGATWSSPVIIDIGAPPHAPARNNDIQIAARADQVLATWTTGGSGFMGSGPLVTAISHDGGRSWSRGANPADDGNDKGHSFVDLAADGSGRVHAVWLDSRDGKQGLIQSASDDGGRSWSTNRVLDARTCECCWNTVASDGAQVAVLYRAFAPRDMRVITSSDRGVTWSESHSAGAFNWAIEACPHAGGGLTWSGPANARRLHAVVWTGADGVAGVHHLLSRDLGQTWSAPHPFPLPRARHADIAGDGDHVVVTSTADDGSGMAIWCQSSADGGITWDLPTRLSAPEREVAHPKVIATAQGIRVFWSEKPTDGVWTWQSAVP